MTKGGGRHNQVPGSSHSTGAETTRESAQGDWSHGGATVPHGNASQILLSALLMLLPTGHIWLEAVWQGDVKYTARGQVSVQQSKGREG